MKFIFLFIVILNSTFTQAQVRSSAGRYVHLDNEQCLAWVSNYEQRNNYKITWTGSCVNGKASGIGILTFSINGELNSIYEGELYEGMYSGKGKLNGKGGIQISGDFLNDFPDGECEFISQSPKWRYTGTCKNGKYDGQGVLTNEKEEKYVGQFKAGLRDGKGKYYYLNGDSYDGDWRFGVKEGKGILFYGNGDRFEGEFSKGKFNGMGVYNYHQGGRYEGQWVDGNKNGRGKEFDGGGKIILDGKFVNDEFIEEKLSNKISDNDKLIDTYVVFMTVQDCYEIRKNYADPYLSSRAYELLKKEVKSQEVSFKSKNPKVSVDNLWVEASKQYASGVGQLMRVAKINPSKRDGDISAICGMLNASFLNAVPNANVPKKNF